MAQTSKSQISGTLMIGDVTDSTDGGRDDVPGECDCASSGPEVRAYRIVDDQPEGMPVKPESALYIEKHRTKPQEYRCANCGRRLRLARAEETAYFESVPESDAGDQAPLAEGAFAPKLETASGRTLTIPYAILREPGLNDEGTDVGPGRLITPAESRRRGGNGIHICPVCRSLLEARVTGPTAPPYFAHRKGQGRNCPLHSKDSGFRILSRPREGWKNENLGNTQKRNLQLQIHMRGRHAIVSGIGSPAVPPPDAGWPKLDELKVSTSGLLRSASPKQLAIRRTEFSVPIGDPLDASIELENSSLGVTCTWTVNPTREERRARCMAFFSDDDGVAIPVSDFQGDPVELLILYDSSLDRNAGSTTDRSAAVSNRLISKLESPSPVEGGQAWRIGRHPWDDDDSKALVAALKRHPISTRQLVSLTPLSPYSIKRSTTTAIRADDSGGASFWIRPIIGDTARIEVIPIPYGKVPPQQLTLRDEGKTMRIELADSDEFGEAFVLGIDPRNDEQYLSEHRVLVIPPALWEAETADLQRETVQETSGSQVGIDLIIEGRHRLITPDSHAQVEIPFRPRESNDDVSVQGIELVGPSDLIDRKEFLNLITIEKRALSRSGVRIGESSNIGSIDEFSRIIDYYARDMECEEINIKFEGMGQILLRRKAFVTAAERTRLRIALFAYLAAQSFTKRRLAKRDVRQIIEAVVPEGHRNHGWAAELNSFYRLIRAPRGLSGDIFRQVLEYIREKGPFQESDFNGAGRFLTGLDAAQEILSSFNTWYAET